MMIVPGRRRLPPAAGDYANIVPTALNISR
jgi:hypothetical protein